MITRRVHRVNPHTPARLTNMGDNMEKLLTRELIATQINPDQICTIEPMGSPFPSQLEDKFELITMSSGIEYIALKET